MDVGMNHEEADPIWYKCPKRISFLRATAYSPCPVICSCGDLFLLLLLLLLLLKLQKVKVTHRQQHMYAYARTPARTLTYCPW